MERLPAVLKEGKTRAPRAALEEMEISPVTDPRRAILMELRTLLLLMSRLPTLIDSEERMRVERRTFPSTENPPATILREEKLRVARTAFERTLRKPTTLFRKAKLMLARAELV
jgi:hypothetical protein